MGTTPLDDIVSEPQTESNKQDFIKPRVFFFDCVAQGDFKGHLPESHGSTCDSAPWIGDHLG